MEDSFPMMIVYQEKNLDAIACTNHSTSVGLTLVNSTFGVGAVCHDKDYTDYFENLFSKQEIVLLNGLPYDTAKDCPVLPSTGLTHEREALVGVLRGTPHYYRLKLGDANGPDVFFFGKERPSSNYERSRELVLMTREP